jgi:hypothetical protein
MYVVVQWCECNQHISEHKSAATKCKHKEEMQREAEHHLLLLMGSEPTTALTAARQPDHNELFNVICAISLSVSVFLQIAIFALC